MIQTKLSKLLRHDADPESKFPTPAWKILVSPQEKFYIYFNFRCTQTNISVQT